MTTTEQIIQYRDALKAFQDTEIGKLWRAYKNALADGYRIDSRLENDDYVPRKQIDAQRDAERKAHDALLNAMGANLPIFDEVKT